MENIHQVNEMICPKGDGIPHSNTLRVYLKMAEPGFEFESVNQAIEYFDTTLDNAIMLYTDHYKSKCYQKYYKHNATEEQHLISVMSEILWYYGTPEWLSKLGSDCRSVFGPHTYDTGFIMFNNDLLEDFLSVLKYQSDTRISSFLKTLFRDFHIEKINELCKQQFNVKPCKF